MSSGVIHIDTDALAHNFLAVQAVVAPHVEVGAVVKSNAYQLGIDTVVPTLLQQQCRTFFVMTLDEGIQLQQLLREHQHEIPPTQDSHSASNPRRRPCRVVSLGGVDLSRAPLHIKHDVIPAVVSLRQLNAIRRAAASAAVSAAATHFQDPTSPAVREATPDRPLRADDNGLAPTAAFPADLVDDSTPHTETAFDECKAFSAMHKEGFPIFLQLNTGMNRLGIDANEFEQLAASYQSSFAGLSIDCVMSHLASADEPSQQGAALTGGLTPVVAQQRVFDRLTTILALAHKRNGRLPFQRSLANSAAIFRGDPSLHYDLVRPGIALYGCDPLPAWRGGVSSPAALFRPVVTAVTLPVIQIRTGLLPGVSTIGYNPTAPATATTVGVVSGGYSDGLPGVYQQHFRLWHYHHADAEEAPPPTDSAQLLRQWAYAVPLAGEKGSMDSLCVDLSAIPPAHLPREGESTAAAENGATAAGTHLYLVGPHQTVDQLSGTLGLRPQEVLCRVLSSLRLKRAVSKPRAVRSPKLIARLPAPPKQISNSAGVWIYAMLSLLDSIFDEHQIRYWAEGGTLLGMVRDGGIMRHDDDADLQIHPDDTERLKDCLPAIREKVRQWGNAVGETFHLRQATFGYKLIMEPRASDESWQLWFDTLGGKWACGFAIVDLFITKFDDEAHVSNPICTAHVDMTAPNQSPPYHHHMMTGHPVSLDRKIIYADPVITEMVRKRGYGDILASRLGAIPKREFGPIALRAPMLAEAATVDVFGPQCMSTIEGKDGEVTKYVGTSCILLSVADLVWLEGLRLAAFRQH